MNTRENVIIILADSARYYSTGGKDDRDKLEMMERFEKESIYFTTAVSSAPSSIMSVSAMLTSLSSYYIASNYTDFLFDENKFNSITNILNGEGYEIQSVLNARETRERFDTLLPHVNKKYWPKGLKNSEQNWSNNNINKILFNFISKRASKQPLFLFLFYNVRHDPKTSEEVEKGINILKKFNYWENSIVFLGSDHGYMDPKRGFTPEKLQAMGLGHDLVMSDDNIRIPFYLRYPGFTHSVIQEPVSTLDIVPTILDLLNIKVNNSSRIDMMGSSLLPLILREESAINFFKKRMIRTDGRFFAQTARSTAIRNYKYKYVIRPEMDIEEFYDLENDKWEENNLIGDEKFREMVDKFRKFYNENEKKAIEFQIDNITNNIRSKLFSEISKEVNNILVFGFGEPYYCEIILNSLEKIYPQASSTLLLHSSKQSYAFFKNDGKYKNLLFYDTNNGKCILTGKKMNNKRGYELAIVLGKKNNLGNYDDEYKKLKNIFDADIEVFIDINMNIGVSNTFKDFVRYLNKKKKYFIQHPDVVFRTITKVTKRMKNKLKYNQVNK